jgi:hypothetical protein
MSPSDGAVDSDPGPWVLTWVNGVADQAAIRLCFVPVVDGGETPSALPPIPAGSGLAFGAQLTLSAIAGVDLATDDVRPYLVLGAGAETTCADVLGKHPDAEAGGSGPWAAPLPAIPAGTLREAHSYLAVVTGCAAAPFRASDSGPDLICGADPTFPGPGIVLVRLSRQSARLDFGFQVLHASQASTSLSLTIDDTSPTVRIASFGPLGFGQLVPPNEPMFVPRVSLSQGSAAYSVTITTAAGRSAPPVTLASVVSSSGIADIDFRTDNGLTLVVLGASPGEDAGPFGRQSLVAAVRNDPRGGGD